MTACYRSPYVFVFTLLLHPNISAQIHPVNEDSLIASHLTTISDESQIEYHLKFWKPLFYWFELLPVL